MTKLKSNIEWIQWGKEDPFGGVVPRPDKLKGEAAPWAEEEFLALGALDWRNFWRHWEHYGVNTQSCLEIGCGAGRITKQLAETFDRVYAVDVSEDMIRCARNVVGPNVEFSVIDGLHLPLPDGSVKAVFSTHVLQHLDSEEIGFSYFREIYRVLDAGGTLMIQLPLYQFPGGPLEGAAMRFLHTLTHQLAYIRASFKRRLGIKTMRGTPYSMRGLFDFLARLGFSNIEFRVLLTNINDLLNPFVFASK